MENNAIFNTLSYKIFYSVAQEYIEKYDAENFENGIDSTDAPVNIAPAVNIPQTNNSATTSPMSSTVSASEPVDYQIEESNNTTRNIIISLLVLIVGGIIAWFAFFSGNSKNNPLGVQKPKWKKFAMVNAIDVMLFKEADTSSPNLKLAVERLDGCMPGEKMLWEGDKVPRGYDANNYPVEINTVFPVLDESDEWYKVYIGAGEIREAYLQKKYSQEVKPEPITKEIIDKVINRDYQTYKLVDKGEFANLYIERYMDEMGDGETVAVGVLTDGCIVIPDACYFLPRKSDSTGVDMRNDSNSSEYKPWNLYAPESYWKPSSYDMEGIFDVSLLKNEDIQKIVMAVRPQGETASTVYYYFPTVATDRFISFEYSFSPAAAVEAEEDNVVTKYEEDDKNLMAEIGGKMVNTGISGYAGLEVLLSADLDGDSSLECVVRILSGGTYIEPLFVVTYNADEDKFIKSGDLEYMDEPTIEENGSTNLLLQRTGLRWMKYALEDHKLKKVEDQIKSVGSVHKTIEMDNCYGDEETGDVKVAIDFDGDGVDDELAFHRGMSNAEGEGRWMQLTTVVLSDGSSYNIEINAAKFSILNEKTNGMPDFIGDNYLYRWNGNNYESYGWDGNNFVRKGL